jgi:hypothetical protein
VERLKTSNRDICYINLLKHEKKREKEVMELRGIICKIIIISIQPLGRFWQEPKPSQATCMAVARCILGKFLGVVCHCFPLPFRRFALLPPDASTSPSKVKGETVGENGPLILPK